MPILVDNGNDMIPAAIAAPALSPLFWRGSRVGVDSAWYGHVPFGHWIVYATRPRTLVELGTHAGVSYFAFCEAVVRAQLDTRCVAVDTWQGDSHSGFYDENIFSELKEVHNARYAAFSELLRASFDEAVRYFPDASIDLLHIDGRHMYEDVHHDFLMWKTKLSPRAVVLFHDINVREREFGVWQLWDELSKSYPTFEFIHDHGLGILAFGDDVPEPIAQLCGLRDTWAAAAIRERFTHLGRLSRLEAESVRQRFAIEGQQQAIEGQQRAIDGQQRVLKNQERAIEVQRHELSAAQSRMRRSEHDLAEVQGRVDRLTHELAAARMQVLAVNRNYSAQLRQLQNPLQSLLSLRRERQRVKRVVAAIRRSELFKPEWYLDRNEDIRDEKIDPYLHYARSGADEGRDPGPEFSTTGYILAYPDVIGSGWNPLEHYELFGRAEGRDPAPREGFAVPLRARMTPTSKAGLDVVRVANAGPDVARVAFVSGEPHTAGHIYRIEHLAEAAKAIGAQVSVQTVSEAAADPSAVESAKLMVIWRAEWNEGVERIVELARRSNTAVLFDVDDLMFDPNLARIPIIDGIRSQGLTEEEVQGFYARIQQTMMAADFCSATTPYLSAQVRRWQKPTFVLPNGFDAAIWRAARLAVRRRRNQGSDGLVRIGYAGGSRTHQRDFGVIAGAVARVLAERPECRLVLFRLDSVTCLDLHEFPALASLSQQVEWRELVPLRELPLELARFDINLAPLETGNPFCESKSELKFFEAALAGVPSICSPTRCYRAAIRDSITGILAESEEGWYAGITKLLDDPAQRARMARDAYLDVLWNFGPERRAERMYSLLEQVLHRGRRAARAFELELARAGGQRPELPNLPAAETILHSDQEQYAEVTVIVPLHNYAGYVPEALDSVFNQTLDLIDLIVIDDQSTDDSLAVARDWIDRNLSRFNRALLLRNHVNAGLALTRNVGFAAAETPFVLQLDADNKLLPECAARCLQTIKETGSAFVYPTLQQFGDGEKTFSESPYDPQGLVGGNYIDATALVSLSAWAAVGGYEHVPYGWEDYNVWCRFAERGMYGHHVPEILALYRVHSSSMLHTVTDLENNKRQLVATINARHSWALEEFQELVF